MVVLYQHSPISQKLVYFIIEAIGKHISCCDQHQAIGTLLSLLAQCVFCFTLLKPFRLHIYLSLHKEHVITVKVCHISIREGK